MHARVLRNKNRWHFQSFERMTVGIMRGAFWYLKKYNKIIIIKVCVHNMHVTKGTPHQELRNAQNNKKEKKVVMLVTHLIAATTAPCSMKHTSRHDSGIEDFINSLRAFATIVRWYV